MARYRGSELRYPSVSHIDLANLPPPSPVHKRQCMYLCVKVRGQVNPEREAVHTAENYVDSNGILVDIVQ